MQPSEFGHPVPSLPGRLRRDLGTWVRQHLLLMACIFAILLILFAVFSKAIES